MPTIAHYEVYTLEDTGWVLHARYMNSEKTRALEEAQALETYLGRPTKVMRESYDPETNRYGEQTVFLSPKAVEWRRREHERRGRKRSGHDEDLGDTEWGRPPSETGSVKAGFRPNVQMPAGLGQFSASTRTGLDGRSRFGAPTHARSTGDLLARVFFVLMASLVVATAGAALIPVVINMLRGFDVVIDSRSLSSSVFSVFMVLLLLTGIVLTLRVVPLQGVRSSQKRRRRTGETRDTAPTPSPAPVATGTGPAASTESPAGISTGGAGEGPDKETMDRDVERQKEQRKNEEQEAEKEKRKKEKAVEAQKIREKEQESQRQSEGDQEVDQPDDDNNAASPAEPTSELPPTPAFQSSHATTMAFLGAYVAALKTLRPKLDPYNRFGINLYLAGVCETIAQTAHLSQEEFHRLLRETVEVMGTPATQATSFVERLDTYLVEDRYAEMVRCGREAMTVYQSGPPSGANDVFANLGMVLEEWNTPKTQKITGSTIAIVFTDMVGSTDLTSEHGDVKAQQILRAHNAAVRSALARFSGREIKHTGDGIMATFEHVPDAVWGMIDVLKAVRAHNQAEPEIPLRIRIGINAGEPISAENDYYGLAVTVAARVCAKAEMDEIIVTQIVCDMCEGTKLVFEERGTTLLKGIKDPQRLHEAIWEGAPSRRARIGATTDAGEPEEEEVPVQPSHVGPAALPSQPGGGRDRPGGATVDPDADGWDDPHLDADGRAVADDAADPGAAFTSGTLSDRGSGPLSAPSSASLTTPASRAAAGAGAQGNTVAGARSDGRTAGRQDRQHDDRPESA